MGKTVNLTAGDGHGFQAYLAEPTGTPRFGLVVVQEIFGVNPHIRGLCDGFAADGILAVAPALFDRVEREVELGYDAEGVAAGRALRGQIGWDDPLRDIAAAAHIAAIGGRVGIVGYCWGGSLAWLTACRMGGTVAAAVGYYGGQIHDFRAETPQVPVMLHFGEKDAMIPPDHVAAIAAAHPDVPVHSYPAGHGFGCDARADYHADSARTARARTLDFFVRHLAG
ncbi:MAG: dienelactone hydrolase family protein [Alphaproteobacteria bacterium]